MDAARLALRLRLIWRPRARFRARAPPAQVKDSMDIFVGNLPWSMSDEALQDIFSAHGSVDRVKIVTDRDTGRSRGFAFVTMNDDAEAKSAIAALNGSEQEGRALTVRLAEPRGSGGGGGGGGRGGGGGGGRGGFSRR